DTGEHAALRHHNLHRRVAGELIRPGERVVVPGDGDRGRALSDRARLGDDRDEVPCLVHLCEEGETGLASLFAGLGALRQARREDAENAWFEARGSPASATCAAYSGFVRSAQSVGVLATRSLFTMKDMTP